MIPKNWRAKLLQARKSREAAGLARSLREVTPIKAGRALVDGREVLSFASNDYLGLAAEPELLASYRAQSQPALQGAGASRLITGTQPEHIALEAELAQTRGCESALFLPTGYQANLAAISALADRETLIFSDALNHASLIDGCRASRAQVKVYPHADMQALAKLLDEASAKAAKLIVSDTLFSMDGDCADLPKLVALAREYGALLLVDDAHGFGALGASGGGVPEMQGVGAGEIGVLTGTCSKALGGLGGYICSTREVIEQIINAARPFIFSTAPPPSQCEHARAALRWLASEEADRRRAHLAELATRLRDGIRSLGYQSGGSTQIVPLWLDRPMAAVEMSNALLSRGVFAPGIRPPTVPAGRGMLRFSLSAAHSIDDVEHPLLPHPLFSLLPHLLFFPI